MERWNGVAEKLDPASQSYPCVAPSSYVQLHVPIIRIHLVGTAKHAYGAKHGVHRRRVHPVECSLRIRCCSQYMNVWAYCCKAVDTSRLMG